jgi:hypothetical protein
MPLTARCGAPCKMALNVMPSWRSAVFERNASPSPPQRTGILPAIAEKLRRLIDDAKAAQAEIELRERVAG